MKQNLFEVRFNEATEKYRGYLKTKNHALLAESIQLFEKLLNFDPHHKRVPLLMAESMLYSGNTGLTVHLLRSYLQDFPNDWIALMHLGAAYRKENFIEKTKECWNKALECNVDDAQKGLTCYNMSGIYADSGEPEEAIRWVHEAIDLGYKDPLVYWHESLALLSMGKLKEGFDLYRFRKQMPSWHERKGVVASHKWDGKSALTIDCNDMYVHGEQGVGDEVMFLAAFSELVSNGFTDKCYVVLEVNKKVQGLAAESFNHYKNIKVVNKEPDGNIRTVDCDLKISLGDLYAGIYGERWYSRPASEKRRYLFIGGEVYKPVAKTIMHQISDKNKHGLRVGLAWVGGTRETRIESRSYELSCYDEILNSDDFDCFNLQYHAFKEIEDECKEYEGKLKRISPEAEGGDLLVQGAAAMAMSFVVTNQQTLAHVCGALGVRCYAFIPHNPQWRYGKSGSHMPWYGNHVTLLRKPKTISWDVFIKAELRLIMEKEIVRAEQAETDNKYTTEG